MDKQPKTPSRPSGIPRLAASRLPLPTSTASRPLRPSPSRDKLQADPGLDVARLRRPSEESLFKKPLPKYSTTTKPSYERLAPTRKVSVAEISDDGRSEFDVSSEAGSTTETSTVTSDAEIRGRQRPSLSDRTIETLSQIPPSPGSVRRQSSFFNGSSPIRSPSRPPSSMSGYSRSPSRSSTSRQQSGSNFLPQPPSVIRLPSRPRANGSSHDDSSSAAVESTSRLKRPSARQTLGPDALSPNATTFQRPDVSPARTSLFGGRSTTTPPTKPHPSSVKSSAKPTMSDMGPPPQPLLIKKTRKVPSHSSLSLRSPSTASKTSSATSATQESLASEQESEKETRTVPKSSSALRESIAKAKAARKASAQTSSRTASADPWASVVDPFNQGPNDPNQGLLKKRVETGRTSGSLNIAAMSLTELPEEVLTMYDFDPNANTDWYESVDLIKFIAADNELAALPDSAFPDLDPSDFNADVDEKGHQFAGLEVLDLHGNIFQSLPIGLRRLQRLLTLNLSNNQLVMDSLQVVLELESLRELKLAKNQLQGSLTTDIGRLGKLETLDLSGNSLTKLPESLAELTSLRTLNVGNNQLTSMPVEVFSKASLRELIAPKNQLSGTLIPASVCRMENLQTLDVVGNVLERLTESESLDLPSLQTLSISVNRIKALPNVSTWQSLLTLSADENSLTDVPQGFVSLKGLKHVDLAGNDISKLDEKIGLMENLATLRVANNPLRDRKFLSMNTDDIKRDLRNRCEPELHDTDDDEGSVATQFTLAPESPEQEINTWKLKSGGVLDRSYTELQELELDRLAHLDPHEIRCLYLQHNQIRHFPIPALSILAQNLADLDLSSNPLDASGLFPSSLTLPNLQNLNLSATGLTSLDPLLSNLSAPSLNFLDVSCNRITGALPLVRQSYPKLMAMIISDNQLKSVDFDAVQGLQVLDIGNNNIESLPPQLGLLRAEGVSKNWGSGGSALKRFEVAGNSFRVPRWQVVAKGTEAILEWLKDRIRAEDLAEWEPEEEAGVRE